VEELAALSYQEVPDLIGALQSSDGYVRSGVAEALGRIGDLRAYGALALALEVEGGGRDEDFEAQIQAAVALERLGDRRAVSPLMRSLSRTIEGNGNVAPYIIDALGSLRAQEAVSVLRSLRAHWNPDVRTAAQRALSVLDPGAPEQ
jgi:HEAT repeat protein